MKKIKHLLLYSLMLCGITTNSYCIELGNKLNNNLPLEGETFNMTTPVNDSTSKSCSYGTLYNQATNSCQDCCTYSIPTNGGTISNINKTFDLLNKTCTYTYTYTKNANAYSCNPYQCNPYQVAVSSQVLTLGHHATNASDCSIIVSCGWCGRSGVGSGIGVNTTNCGTITSINAWHDGGSVGTTGCGTITHGRDTSCIVGSTSYETHYQTCYQTCYYCDDSSYTLNGSYCSKPLTTTQPAAVHCQTN